MTLTRKFRLALAVAALTLAAAPATLAQTTAPATASAGPLKIGYTNVDYVLSQMPESKQIESQLKDYSTQLKNQLDTKVAEYRTKGEAYQKGAATMTDVIRADKEKELTNLQQSIQEFQQNAEQSVQQKQQQLLKPVLDKVQKTIDAVSEKNGYTYVFNSDAGYGTTPILLHGPKDGDISDLVLKEMGVTPGQNNAPAATAKPASTPAATPAAPASSKTKVKKK
ncbi:OmpH family outer membrane protein [Hymenobacter busanensis]|uniref:OmpH family outer membrane protein n=1 Tax=Hymenobacter busanensis TaxID=2607656 RepID=A0A7L5A091_9BACT|nr:OmpH family outer membrane protein [Hymenobacter busanensis]KAA9331543.1 OmpH family outer membrane protein [Hymenobacter busanensis]QHJ08697.1 OmpH family outer membrane protein [Hymenobacter busanensis]